ncbi:MAG TPA: hypothetical protein VGJ37_10155 [Pyrinomonadaceae bacterium]
MKRRAKFNRRYAPKDFNTPKTSSHAARAANPWHTPRGTHAHGLRRVAPG